MEMLSHVLYNAFELLPNNFAPSASIFFRTYLGENISTATDERLR